MGTPHKTRNKRVSCEQVSQPPQMAPSPAQVRDRDKEEILDFSASTRINPSNTTRVEVTFEAFEGDNDVSVTTTGPEVSNMEVTTTSTSLAQGSSSAVATFHDRTQKNNGASADVNSAAKKNFGDHTGGRNRCAAFVDDQIVESPSFALEPDDTEPRPRPLTQLTKSIPPVMTSTDTKPRNPFRSPFPTAIPSLTDPNVATRPAVDRPAPQEKNIPGQNIGTVVTRAQAQVRDAFSKARKQIDTFNRAQGQLDHALESPVVPIIVQLRSSKPVTEDLENDQKGVRAAGPFGTSSGADTITDRSGAAEDAANRTTTTRYPLSRETPLQVPHISISEAVRRDGEAIIAHKRCFPSATGGLNSPSFPESATTNTGPSNGAAALSSKKSRFACQDANNDILENRYIQPRPPREKFSVSRYDGSVDGPPTPKSFSHGPANVWPQGPVQVARNQSCEHAPSNPRIPFKHPTVSLENGRAKAKAVPKAMKKNDKQMGLGPVKSIRFAPFKFRISNQDQARGSIIDLTGLDDDDEEQTSDDADDLLGKTQQYPDQAQAPLQKPLTPPRRPAEAISPEPPVSIAPTVQYLQARVPHLKDITKCASCGEEPRKYLVCARCLRTRYCGKYCQVWDWQLHRLVCVRSDNATDEEIAELEDWLDEYWSAATCWLKDKVVDKTEPMAVDDESVGQQNGGEKDEEACQGDGPVMDMNTGEDEQLVDEGERKGVGDMGARRQEDEQHEPPAEQGYVLERVLNDLGGPESPDAALAASFVAFGCGFNVVDWEPDWSDSDREDGGQGQDGIIDGDNDGLEDDDGFEDGEVGGDGDEGSNVEAGEVIAEREEREDCESGDKRGDAEESFFHTTETKSASAHLDSGETVTAAPSLVWQHTVSLHLAQGRKLVESDWFEKAE